MNILPKKSWHVRTKENIARVRRDEALAAQQEQERLRRVALAEQEFRTSILRKQAAERHGATGETSDEQRTKLESGQDAAKRDASIVGTSGHINFFQHLEEGERVAVPNEEYLREQREEKEKYEKSIGYLTYLGQGSREETKQKAWFETLPVDRGKELQRVSQDEVKQKAKALDDPLMVVKRLAGVDRSDLSSAGSAKPATASSTPASPPHPSQATGTAGRQNCGQHSSAAAGERSAKKSRKDMKPERREKRGKTKKKKHSRKKSRNESDDGRHATSKKRRRRSPSSSDSSSSEGSSSAEETEVRRIRLERLRAERLQRERQERLRADRLLSGQRGQPSPDRHGPPEPQLKQRYNAQFNPYLARQNYHN